MKQYLIAITMLLTLATTTQAAAQKHRHSANVTATVPATSADTSGIEAFSDTTGAVADSTYVVNPTTHIQVSTPLRFFDSVDLDDFAGMFFIICIVIILFLLSPVFIIAAIFYFINKGRKDKLKLAQMAIQNGQPVPDQLLRDTPIATTSNYRGGVTQIFLGIGLMVFLGCIIGKLGFGIGALVFFIGLSKLVIAIIDKQSEKKTYDYIPRQTPPKYERQTPPEVPTDNAE